VDRTALVLVRASHLRNMVKFFNPLELQVYDLTTLGWCTYEQSVQQKLAELEKLASEIDIVRAEAFL
jgi:hypothetical protein